MRAIASKLNCGIDSMIIRKCIIMLMLCCMGMAGCGVHSETEMKRHAIRRIDEDEEDGLKDERIHDGRETQNDEQLRSEIDTSSSTTMHGPEGRAGIVGEGTRRVDMPGKNGMARLSVSNPNQVVLEQKSSLVASQVQNDGPIGAVALSAKSQSLSGKEERARISAESEFESNVPSEDTGKTPFHTSFNNLEKIAAALQKYYDQHGAYPPASISVGGRKLLSWRVLLLPYLGHEDLYRRFRLQEPWNSSHNRRLLDSMPDVYRVMGRTGHRTNYVAVVGDSYALRWTHGRTLDEFGDGPENTALIIEVPDELAVPWTEPRDYEPPPQTARLGASRDDGFFVIWASCEVGFARQISSPVVLKSMLTLDHGELFFSSDVAADVQSLLEEEKRHATSDE